MPANAQNALMIDIGLKILNADYVWIGYQTVLDAKIIWPVCNATLNSIIWILLQLVLVANFVSNQCKAVWLVTLLFFAQV